MVICSDSKAVRSNRAHMGIATGPCASSRGGILGSSAPTGANLGGGGGHLLGTRASSTGNAAPSSSDAGEGLGEGVLVASSTLGIGNRTLSKEVGATKPFPSPFQYLCLHVKEVSFLYHRS